MNRFIYLRTLFADTLSLIQGGFPDYQLALVRSWCILLMNRASHTDRNLDYRTFDPEHRGIHRVVASESDPGSGGCPAVSGLASAPAIRAGPAFRRLGAGGH